jgi:putative MATE family efflux protein
MSGTGLMFPLFFLFMAMGQSIGIGIASLVGRVIGQNDRELASHIIPSGMVIALAIAVPAVLFSVVFEEHFVRFLAGSGLSAEAIGYGQQFYSWLLPGLAIMLFMNMFAGVLQGEGLTKRIMVAMVLSTVLNIVLDPVFIFALHMGVAGAGLATSLSIAIAAGILIASFLRKKSSFPFSLSLLKVKPSVVMDIIRIGFPNFLSMASLAISFMVFNKIVSNIGETTMNAWALVGRMDQIVLIPSFAVGSAVVTMVAQNFGRGLHGRVLSIYNRSLILGMGLVACVALVYTLTAPWFFRLFSDVPEVVSLAALQVRVLAFTFVGLSAAIVTTSAFQALGRPFPALFLALIRMGLISIPIALFLVFVMHLKIWGVFIALIAGNLAAIPIAILTFRRVLSRTAAGVAPTT